MIEYASIYLIKHAEYARILNVSDVLYSISPANKLCNNDVCFRYFLVTNKHN